MSPTLLIDTVLPHLGAIIGFGLGFILIARLMREKRRPSNTFAWLLIIILVPYVGVPLFLLFGGRKIAKLSRDKDSLRIPSNLSQNSAVTPSPFGLIATGNRTQFIPTGIEAYEALIDSIKDAKHSIDITTFILSHDAVGRRVVKELSNKAREGVEVRLLIDAIGSWGKKTLYMLDLEKAGGRIERFMPVFPFAFPGATNLRNHRKIAIFDQSKAIVGGRNIGRDYMGPTISKGRWVDLGISIEGPAVTALNAIFEQDWKFASRKRGYVSREPTFIAPLEDAESTIEIMASGPDTTGDPLYEKVLSSIQEAEESIKIVTPYFILDDVLLRSLIVKARTGKQVTLIVPRKSNHRLADLARIHFLRELYQAGVKILAYEEVMMHAKALLIDDKIAMTGSANMDLRSLFMNYEVAAFLYSRPETSAMAEWIQSLEENCTPLGADELAHKKRLKGIAEDLSQLIAPLL
ncbi:phospholipase D-like domain-containing protein [Pelagicoccus sp. SDUM812003]|uniref:phospholipase D-like domain-containing protein n=1 Tax=Pelagicoccus sp. SDUM812003 TaxID=3041267 RepID=UPI00280F04E6|nr:phospholipase D-like domain-containing protein [Pelagicoccus sp. SDUM812003]MDQ8204462.1 phospholipase D-like domain-containing protein [Pelagicoccus sp. SDUM812003]